MGRTLIIAKKEMGSLLEEKTLVLAIIIQLLIASFSSLLIIGLASFFDPSALDKYDMGKAKVGIVGEGELKDFIEKGNVRIYNYRDVDAALSDFYKNKIDAVLVIPGESSGGTDLINIVLYLPKSDLSGVLVTLSLKKPLEEFETFVRDVRAPRIGFEPVKLNVDNMPRKTSIYFEFIYGMLIPLLVFTPVFISGGLVIDMLTEEYERKTMDLLLVSPLSFTEVLNGKMLVAVAIVPFQVLLWLMLLGLNHIAVHNISIILLLATILAGIIVMIAAVIAVIYKDRAISQYIYALILILIFLTSYLFPDSPFNLVARLASGGIGVESLIYCALFASSGIPLYVLIRSKKIMQ